MTACAPAPLYTASGSNRTSVKGEVPRDSRGEPIWHMIAPARPADPKLSMADAQELARRQSAPVEDEGSGEGRPQR